MPPQRLAYRSKRPAHAAAPVFELPMTGHNPGVAAVQEAVADRLTGNQPSRLKSALVATTIGFTAAVVAYKLLRSGSGKAADDSE